jgi:hypothetical protein
MHATRLVFRVWSRLCRRSHSNRSPANTRLWRFANAPTPLDLVNCETPDRAAAYWRLHVEQHPYFNPECECFVR